MTSRLATVVLAFVLASFVSVDRDRMLDLLRGKKNAPGVLAPSRCLSAAPADDDVTGQAQSGQSK
jgi:hypothetical protein